MSGNEIEREWEQVEETKLCEWRAGKGRIGKGTGKKKDSLWLFENRKHLPKR